MKPLLVIAAVAAILASAYLHAHPIDGTICPLCSHVGTKSGNYTVTDSDDVILITGTSTMTLPACDSTRQGRTFSFARNGAAITATIGRSGADVFAGGLTTNLLAVDLAGKSYTCDGAGTWIIR